MNYLFGSKILQHGPTDVVPLLQLVVFLSFFSHSFFVSIFGKLQ